MRKAQISSSIFLHQVYNTKVNISSTKITNRNYFVSQLIVCCSALCFGLMLIDFRRCRMDHQLQEWWWVVMRYKSMPWRGFNLRLHELKQNSTLCHSCHSGGVFHADLCVYITLWINSDGKNKKNEMIFASVFSFSPLKILEVIL